MPRRRLSEEEREQRREESRKRLQEAVVELQSSEGWRRWIALRRENGLGRYSFRNTVLLAKQMAARGLSPSFVAGYRWWAEHGYQVRKGEKALWILGPVRRKVEDETTGEKVIRVVGFRDVAVFDRTQVEAGPAAVALGPPEAEPIDGDSHEALLAPLERLAGELGVELLYEDVPGAAGGYFDPRPTPRRIVVDVSAPPNAKVRTTLHELGHAMVAAKRDEDANLRFSYAEEECIVECAGHVAAASAGLDTSGEAVPYVAGWGEGGSAEVVEAAAELVDAIARRLERALTAEEAGPASAPGSEEGVGALV